MKKNRRISLSIKIYNLIILLVFCSALFSIVVSYREHVKTTDEIYEALSSNIAETVSNSLNGTRVRTLVNTCTDSEYQKLLARAREENNSDLIKEYLLEWIEYRRDLIRSMLLNNQIQVMEKQHMNDVLLFVFNKDNAEETLKICKASSSRKDTIEKLMKKYKITSLQAATIADMRLYHFNKDIRQSKVLNILSNNGKNKYNNIRQSLNFNLNKKENLEIGKLRAKSNSKILRISKKNKNNLSKDIISLNKESVKSKSGSLIDQSLNNISKIEMNPKTTGFNFINQDM